MKKSVAEKRKVKYEALRKKSFQPKKQKATNAIMRVSPLLPFPPVKYVRLVYSDSALLTCTSGAIANHIWCMNGIYDPDISGTGGQPRFFDTLLGADDTHAPYQRYQVVSAIPHVTFMNINAGSTSICDVGFGFRKDIAAAPSSANEAYERNYYYCTVMSTDENAQGVKYMAPKYLKISDIFGPAISQNSDMYGTHSSNPAVKVFMDTFAQPIDGATSASYRVRVKIEYTVKLFGLRDVADS